MSTSFSPKKRFLHVASILICPLQKPQNVFTIIYITVDCKGTTNKCKNYINYNVNHGLAIMNNEEQHKYSMVI